MLKRKMMTTLISAVATFLIMVAPMMVASANSYFFWGEPVCPKSLKE